MTDLPDLDECIERAREHRQAQGLPADPPDVAAQLLTILEGT
jgi:hypothetical protein